MPGTPSKRRRQERRSRSELSEIRRLLDPEGLARRSTVNLVRDELVSRNAYLDTWVHLHLRKVRALLTEIHRCHHEAPPHLCDCAFCLEHRLTAQRDASLSPDISTIG